MRLRPLVLGGAVILLAGGLSCSSPSGTDLPDDPSGNGSGSDGESAQPRPAYEKRAIDAGGIVSAKDEVGRPRFIWATRRIDASPGSTPEAAAQEHLVRFAPAYGVEKNAVVSNSSLDAAGTTRTRGGDYLVRLRQKVDGLEVYQGDVKIVMRSDMSLIALSGTPSDLTGSKPGGGFDLSAGQALSRALEDLYGISVPDASTSSAKAATGAHVWLDMPASSPIKLSEPARARPILYREGGKLVRAYFMEFYSSDGLSTDSDAFRYIVAADNGRVLEHADLTHDVAFTYRVYADADAEGRPFDGPTDDLTPHPTGEPDETDPGFVLPNFVAIETIKSEPAGAIDPWLPANAVQTLGNNVDAYADLVAPDGYSNQDRRATTTAPGVFNRVYLTDQEPLSTARQTQAATTNLFYVVNWLHDYWYDSGFTEAAGNAQDNNFGRGGEDRDALKAEAQDFGGLNNANMSTPSDGLQPRMQMFLWTAPSIRELTIEPGALDLATGAAAFGPAEFSITGDMVLGDDGVPPNNDACSPITNDVAGRIVLVDRGACSFALKALAIEQAGGIGMVLANNTPLAPPPGMGQTAPPTVVTIPSLSVTFEDGQNLRTLLDQGVVTATFLSAVLPPGRDGSLDNMIVAHEWGHYFHHRLQNCGSLQCSAMSEGWGDFIALHTSLREGDDLDGTYAAAYYADRNFGPNVSYFGIRRFPYSVDFTRNALTFGHIQNAATLPPVPIGGGGPNSEVHNAGEVWASMLFEAYVELQKNPNLRTFAEVRRDYSDYLVLGLQLTPINATMTETRDGILAAAQMLNPDDVAPIAAAFARRGAGSCAVSPPRDVAGDLAPVTESFEVQPAISLTSIVLDDSVDTCDLDGTLDAGETGQVTVEVSNTSPVALAGSTVTLSSPTTGVVFPDGPSAALPDVGAFGTQSVAISIGLDSSVTGIGSLDLTVTVDNPTACVASVAQSQSYRINADEIAASSATEDVESLSPPWSKTGTGADTIWSRDQLDPTNHAWHGADSGTVTDTQLTTPSLQVSATGDFTMSFAHSHSFEADSILWDGGVIEFSTDEGASWTDISTIVDPGYTGVITDTSGNPLGGRNAFGAANASFPDFDNVTLNLGTALAGQAVLIRFRIGTDAAVGAPGWTIDNIAFTGIDNTPFTTVVPHAGMCQEPPVANAGPDALVRGARDVILDASASTDPNGDPMTFLWTQTSGPPVALLNANTAFAAFRSPELTHNEALTFQVQVSDAFGSSTDSVKITVRKIPASGGGNGSGGGETDGGGSGDDQGIEDNGPDESIDDGGCAAGSRQTSLPFAMLFGLGLLVMRRRRR